MPETTHTLETAAARFAELNARLEDDWFDRYPTRLDEPEFAKLVDETAEAYEKLVDALGRKPSAADISFVDVSDTTEGEPLMELDLYGARIGYIATDLPNPRYPYLNLGWTFTGMGFARTSVEHDHTLLVRFEERNVPVWRELQFLFAPATIRRAQRDAKSEALSRLAIGRNRTRSREKLPV